MTPPANEPKNWQGMKDLSVRLLEERTGEDLTTWNQRITAGGFKDEHSLRSWLTGQGVTGYAQTLLVMERFGYPDFFLASADELIDGQYADRPHLRPIFDAILETGTGLGEVTIQARKGYVSLLSPRRTFARIQSANKREVFLGLRLDGVSGGRRLLPSKIHDTMKFQINLSSASEVDEEVVRLLEQAYRQNL